MAVADQPLVTVPEAPASAPSPDRGAWLAAAARARATLRASLPDELWDEDAGRVAHARTLAMLGLAADADRHLSEGDLAATVERMHLLHAADDWEAAIAVGLTAIPRFPAHACGLRNSVASMLSGLGRHADALALLDENLRVEPAVPLWAELAALVRERLAEEASEGDAERDADLAP